MRGMTKTIEIIDGKEVPVYKIPTGMAGSSLKLKDIDEKSEEEMEIDGLELAIENYVSESSDDVKIKAQRYADTGDYEGCAELEDYIQLMPEASEFASLFDNN